MAKINWKNLINKGKGLVNSVAKLGSKLGGTIGAACSAVDALIPDEQQKKMESAASKEGTTSTQEVEKTVRSAAAGQGITDEETIKSMTKALTSKVAASTGTAIDNSNASVTVSKMDKFKQMFAKYKWYILGGLGAVIGVVIFLVCRKKGGKGRRRR